MGTVGSKSPLERRNTVARRSQRRTLHSLKPKVEHLHKDIKKFKGVTEDVNYVALKNEIEYFRNDLMRKRRDLQPQVRNLYETIYKRVSEAEEALQTKLQENREKQEKKESKQKENGNAAPNASNDVMSEITSDMGDYETVVDVHAESEEAHQLENSEEKRKTVELKFVKVIPDEESPKSNKGIRMISPPEKRKSILKVGVPVMPGAVINELAAQNSRITRHYDDDDVPVQRTVQDVVSRIHNIIEILREIELEINDFVGKKNGKQYVRIRDTLNKYLIELNSLSPVDDYALDQMKVCRNYIGSCLSFLDERATDDVRRESFTSDDDVFENNNVPPLTKVEENFRLQKLLRNTPV